MKKTKHFILAFFVLLATLLVGCGTENKEEATKNQQTEANKIIDREGNEIVLPEKTDKIISLAPSITETLLNLGLGNNLVAVDKYSLELENINKDLPVFDIMNPDAENIVALKPDIIFGTGMSKSNGTDPFAPMVDMGSFVTVVPTSNSIEGVKEDILFIGKVTKKEEEAKNIVSEFDKKLQDILSIIEKNKENVEPMTVYFEISPSPNPHTFGKDTFLNDILNILGAKNIFEDQNGWLSVSEEQIVDKNPNVIFTNATFEKSPVEDIKNRAGWENIDAIKNDRVYLIDKDSSSRANEKSIKAIEEIAKALYPSLFEN